MTTNGSLRLRMGLISLVSLMAMAYVDYATSYELVFSAAYLLPVSICAWYFEKRAVWLMAIACGLTSWWVDINDGHDYSHSMFEYWNSFTCFIISIVTGLLLQRVKKTLEERRKMNTELQNALAELKQSTEEIRKLQNGLQVVCAWTKRIKVGDQWMTPDEFLSTQLHLKITHGLSPEAGKEFEQEENADAVKA